jgi:hypothetical protein
MDRNLKQLFEAKKSFAAPLEWVSSDRDLRISCPLNIGAVTIEGLEFLARTSKHQIDRDVHFMLRAQGSRKVIHLIERICWRPKTPHNNRGRGPAELRFRTQTTAHAHSFRLNWLDQEDRMDDGNLPLAEPVEIDHLDVSAAFAFAADRFNIAFDGVCFPPPPWEGDLFNE